MEMPSVLSRFRRPNGLTESQSLLTDLVAALEHATQSAKQLSHHSSDESCHLPNAFASLRNAHLQIGTFLDRFQSMEKEEEDEDDPMAEEDTSSSRAMEKVQEGMRDCALRNPKRCKRPLSPSMANAKHSNWKNVEALCHGWAGYLKKSAKVSCN
ncbi:hypothetical protein MRB53_019555 [Persea americana]|uniref:Uncharacterized protein n=1 Tax=Persea americana TaxID=3435 RepID=A0ACC2KZM1_PERAE|nr:hypothetical protein MRB53_019555 [Persea americana]